MASTTTDDTRAAVDHCEMVYRIEAALRRRFPAIPTAGLLEAAEEIATLAVDVTFG